VANHQQAWENYHRFADERGRLVAAILRQFAALKGKTVLDYGCGDGGTSRTLARLGAKVTAIDIKPEIKQAFQNLDVKFCNAQNEALYLKSQEFDIIILQDVLEHVPNPEKLINQAKEALRPHGLIYISTPNRFSLLNIISDPHWNLPGVALGSRWMVAFLVQKIFRRDMRDRGDWAALLSLNKLKKLLTINNFEMIFVNSFVAKILFQKPQSVVCHPQHIRFVQWMKRHHLDRWIDRLVNDRAGLFNFFINPTWYVIGKVR
jgi:2-polyprenyl-3-methyl-5-hydroxy-6-metoxy-1,4-benzoquinol methylase